MHLFQLFHIKMFKIHFLILILVVVVFKQEATSDISNSLYYQEKYFRFLANNYDQIEQGNFWTSLGPEKGIGFKAKDNFGSFILVKDWSMYSFKLTKILFRPSCSYTINEKTFDAEMQLIHTLDNGYYPPGKRINLGINYLVISVPFKKTTDKNPANSKLFEFLRLNEYYQVIISEQKNQPPLRISPLKPIKLHHIIQHQPSFLVQSKLQTQQDALYLIFSQYHYISETDLILLKATFEKIFSTENTITHEIKIDSPIYRNWDNPKELVPKPTLMTYNSQFNLKTDILLISIIIAFLF